LHSIVLKTLERKGKHFEGSIPHHLCFGSSVSAIGFAPDFPRWPRAQTGAPVTPAGTLHGQVTDPSGAVVPNATVAVIVSGGTGQAHSATTSRRAPMKLEISRPESTP